MITHLPSRDGLYKPALRQAVFLEDLVEGKQGAFARLALEKIGAEKSLSQHIAAQAEFSAREAMTCTHEEKSSLAQRAVMNQAAEKLASLFFSTLFKSMLSSLEMGDDNGTELWQPYLAEQCGKFLAHSPVGDTLKDALTVKLFELQEEATYGDRVRHANTDDRPYCKIS